MAKQKRAKLNRLASPSSLARAPALGSISQPINKSFKVRTPGPRIHTIADLRNLSSTINKGILSKAQDDQQQLNQSQIVAGRAWLDAHPEYEKNLTTLAKAIEDGILDPTTTEFFWQGASAQRGRNLANGLTGPDSKLLGLMPELQHPDRTSNPTEAFEEVWDENILQALAGNPFALNGAMDRKEALKAKYVQDVNEAYETNSVTAGVAAAHEELMYAIQEQDLDAKALAELTGEKFRAGILGTKLRESSQADAISRAHFALAEQIERAGREGSPEQQLEAIEEAYDYLQGVQDSAVYGSKAKGYSPVFTYGPYESQIGKRLDDLHKAKELGEYKADAEWSQSGRGKVQGIITEQLYGHIRNLLNKSPRTIEEISDRLASATTHSDLVNIFTFEKPRPTLDLPGPGQTRESVWTQEMSDIVLADRRGLGALAAAFDGLVHGFDTTGVSSAATGGFWSIWAEMGRNKQFSAMTALLEDPSKNGNIDTDTIESARIQLAQMTEVAKVKKLPFYKGTLAPVDSLHETLTSQGRVLVGDNLEEYHSIRTELDERFETWVGGLLESHPDLVWTSSEIRGIWEVESAPFVERMTTVLNDNADAQAVATRDLLNKGRLDVNPLSDNEVNRMVKEGKISHATRERYHQLRHLGGLAHAFGNEKSREIQTTINNWANTLSANGDLTDESKERVGPIITAIQSTIAEEYKTYRENKATASEDWSASSAEDWWRNQRTKFEDEAKRAIEGIVEPTGVTAQNASERVTQDQVTRAFLNHATGTGPLKYWEFISSQAGLEEAKKEDGKYAARIFQNHGPITATGLLNVDWTFVDYTDELDNAVRRIADHTTDWSEWKAPVFALNADGQPRAAQDSITSFSGTEANPNTTFDGAYHMNQHIDPAATGVDSFVEELVSGFTDEGIESSPEVRAFMDERNEGLREGQWGLSRHAIKAFQRGEYEAFFNGFTDTSNRAGTRHTETMALDPDKAFRNQQMRLDDDAVAAFGVTRRLDIHGYAGRRGGGMKGGGRIQERVQGGHVWEELSGRPLFTQGQGNGFEEHDNYMEMLVFRTMENADLSMNNRIELAAQLMSMRSEGLSLKHVVNKEAVLENRVTGRLELSAGAKADDEKTYKDNIADVQYNDFGHRRAQPDGATGTMDYVENPDQKRHRLAGFESPYTVDFTATTVTTVTIPLTQRGGDELADWVDPARTRFYPSVAEVKRTRAEDVVDGVFKEGSLPARYLEMENIQVNRSTTAWFLACQAILASGVDPMAPKAQVQFLIDEAMNIYSGVQ